VLPIDAALGWAMWAPGQGFSLSMWFRVERPAAHPADIEAGADADAEAEAPAEPTKKNTCMSDPLSNSWSDWGIISSGIYWLNDGKHWGFVIAGLTLTLTVSASTGTQIFLLRPKLLCSSGFSISTKITVLRRALTL